MTWENIYDVKLCKKKWVKILYGVYEVWSYSCKTIVMKD